MSGLLPYRGRRGTTAEQQAALADPLAPQSVLPPTAASEIVKAARAYLQDPTRPVTPSGSSRHLLQSSCSYSNRPQTSASHVGSNEFLSAAASDGIGWGCKSSSGSQADVWTADAEGSEASLNWDSEPARRAVNAQGAAGSLPGVRRTTASAPCAQQPLPSVAGRASTGSSRARTAGASSLSTGSRLAGLGALAPLRPATAVKALTPDVSAGPAQPAADVVPLAGTGPDLSAVAGAASGPLSGWRCSSPGASEAEAWLIPTAEKSINIVAAREPSTSTESSSVIRSASGGGPCSRGSTAGSCRSRLSSRGSDRPAVTDSLYAAEAELDQLLLDADAAAEQPSGLQASAQPSSAAAGCRQWRRDVLRVLGHIQALSLSPVDAPALLQHCSDLQCLLATAADWGCLQEWVSAAPAPVTAGAQQLQPCVLKSLSSRRTVGSSAGSALQDTGADLHGMLLQSLVRLVDSKKPDVLVKVGAMLLGITPPGSHMLLPATKMLYSLSKDSSNDSRFRHHGVLRPLLHMTAALSTTLRQQRQQQHTSTALLYCSGCLKNVSADATNQKSLGRLGGVSTMAQVLLDQVSIAEAVAAAQQPALQQQRSRHPQHETAAQVVVQASAVLRNLSVEAANAPFFVQQQGLALQALVSVLQPFQHDPEVLLNASRCLSKLSMYDSCRQGLVLLGSQQMLRDSSSAGTQRCSTGSSAVGWSADSSVGAAAANSGPAAVALMVRALLDIQATQPKQWPTGIRLAFTLGQLTTYHAESRPQVAAVPGALDALPGLVWDLVQISQQGPGQEPGQGQGHEQTRQQQGQLASAQDFTIKLLRMLANLAIDRTVGPTLAAKQVTADVLVAVLTGFEYEAAEEVVLNATAALTNLAFYDTPSNKLLQTDADVLLMSLLPLLTSGSEESMCEAARAVGNLARASPAVRAALCDAGSQQGEQQKLQESGVDAQAASSSPQHSLAGPYVLQSLVLLLDHGSWDVVYSVAGALVNLAALAEAGTALSRAGLAGALAGALQRVQNVCGLQDGQQQQEEQEGVCMDASELLLQCVGNMVTASAAAMSDAILGSSGPRCADLSCSNEDLACFSRIVQGLAGNVEGSADQGGDAVQQVPNCIQITAQLVQSRLASLWGM